MAIATHGKKNADTNHFGCQLKVSVVNYPRITIKNLQLTTRIIYSCILLTTSHNGQVAMDGCNGQVFFLVLGSLDNLNYNEYIAAAAAATTSIEMSGN